MGLGFTLEDFSSDPMLRFEQTVKTLLDLLHAIEELRDRYYPDMQFGRITAAPSAAPLETPSVNGVASGLRKSAWNDMPLSESIAPATKAHSTRGMRMSNRMSRS